jgi:hypothetical protein
LGKRQGSKPGWEETQEFFKMWQAGQASRTFHNLPGLTVRLPWESSEVKQEPKEDGSGTKRNSSIKRFIADSL